ncbi:zf-CCHC domain-containing protein [Tanacetum coccineum]
MKEKDLDLWHIIMNDDFLLVAKNKVTKVLKVVPFEELTDELKKKLTKNNEAKMVLYNALPKKEYERIFMCKTAKDILQSLLITYQGNSQVKDNKIDLLVQKYEQFTILEEESINSSFARFNTIIISLKAHDEALDELIGNLKVHEVVMEKDSKIYKGKKERVKSIALKAKKESSDDETSTSESDDEEYSMVVRNFKKFFRRKGNHERRRSHSGKGMTRKAKVIGNALDAVIRIISLANVQSLHETRINKHFSRVIRAILKMKSRTKPTMKLVLWLNPQMSPPPTKLSPLVDDDVSEEVIENNIKVVNNNNIEDESIEVDEFEISIMGELNFFLGLQIKQLEDEIFFNQSKYIKEMLKKFGLEDSKPTKMPMSTEIKLAKDDEANFVDNTKYRGNGYSLKDKTEAKTEHGIGKSIKS